MKVAEEVFWDIFHNVTNEKNDSSPQNFPRPCNMPSNSRRVYPLFSKAGKILSEKHLDLDGKSIQVFQAKSLKQYSYYSCGFHCLYNGDTLFDLIHSEDSQPQLDLKLAELHNKTRFWSFYNKLIVSLLRENQRKQKHFYPWIESNIRRGVMERTYMKFLIRDKHSFSPLPDISMKLLENCFYLPKQITEMQFDFNFFIDLDVGSKTFFVGSVNHWFMVCVNKFKMGELEVIILDSRNWPILSLSDEELRSAIQNCEVMKLYVYDSPKYKGREEEMTDKYFKSLKETGTLVDFLVECCTKRDHFVHSCMRAAFEGVRKEEEKAADVWTFLTEYCSPVHIKMGLLSIFKTYKQHLGSIGLGDRVKKWIDGMLQKLQKPNGELSARMKGVKRRTESVLFRLEKLLTENM